MSGPIVHWYNPVAAAAQLLETVTTVTSHGGLHHIQEGMGDIGDGPRVPQTLHTIEVGIAT